MNIAPETERMCQSKKAYTTPAQAGRVAELRKRDHKQGQPAGYLRVYSCPVCGLYHLTSSKP